MRTKINQIFTALTELESKGCHSVFFEYGNGLLRVRIFKGEAHEEKSVYQKLIRPTREQAKLNEVLCFIEILSSRIMKTVFPCYKREFIKGEKVGEWERITPPVELGGNATQSMLMDGSGYYIDDPDNAVQYFVSYKQESKTDKQ